jgi:hypothetical protein
MLKNRIFEGSRLASLLGCRFCGFLKDESSGLGKEQLGSYLIELTTGKGAVLFAAR